LLGVEDVGCWSVVVTELMGIADGDVLRCCSQAAGCGACCEFIAWERELTEGGEETANFLQTRDKCWTDGCVGWGAEGVGTGLRRIHEAKLVSGVT
jgi:hypothetical protein